MDNQSVIGYADGARVKCAPSLVVSGAVVGRIAETHPHPNADRLWCVTVDIGDRKLAIVHGGTRALHPGDLVPVAPPGSAIQRPDGTYRRMRTRSYRGQRSEGMLCSSDELGWTEDGPDAVVVLCGGTPGQQVRGPVRDSNPA